MADTLNQYALTIQNKKRQGIVKIFATASVILTYLFFIDLGDSMGYEYSKETALPGIGVRALNEEYGASAKTEGAIVPCKEGTCICGGEVTTDRQMLSRKPARVSSKVRAAALYFDKMFFDGDTATDPKSIDGINKRLGTGTQTILAGENGDYLDLDNLDLLIDMVVGSDDRKVLMMSKAMRRTLAQAIRAAGQTRMSLTDWAGDMRPKSYNGIKIEIIGEDHTGTEILDFDETCGDSDVTGSIYCMSFGQSEDEDRIQGIMRIPPNNAGSPFEVEDQGVRGTQDLALVEGRFGLVMFHGKSAARYYGILEGVEVVDEEA